MIKIFKIISFIFFISFSFKSLLANDIGPIEAIKLYEENKIIIIDVRNKSEWEETGIIPGVHLVQMLNPIFKIRKNFIEDITKILGPDKNIAAAVICKSGGRSNATMEILKEEGYINISNIAEGMVGDGEKTGWITRKLPLEECKQKCE